MFSDIIDLLCVNVLVMVLNIFQLVIYKEEKTEDGTLVQASERHN